jgi:feruloyl esterase
MVPAFCRVKAVASPSSDSQINLEVWIPAGESWNGKLLGTANGGFSGAIPFGPMTAALAKGYAVVGTDTGHTGDQLDFAANHPEKVIDWGYRAVHVMTEVAKLVVRNHQGRFPDRSYFEGCSTGGQQALSEVQRFPDDYDGVVAGDPGYNRVRLILGFLWGWNALHDEAGRSILPNAKLATITKAVVSACDLNDGVKDGVIDDPRSCTFDPKTIQCTGADSDACLTAPQVAAVQKVYDGAKNVRTGEVVYPGWIRGSEQGWTQYLTGPREPVRIGFFRSIAFQNPSWDGRSFDWDRDIAFVLRHDNVMSAVSRDLRPFKARQGKVLMYTGWADPVVPPMDVVNYYENVAKTMGGMAATQSFFRFFPVPGMGHCNGGAGPSSFDALGALEEWVEKGVAPSQILATHSTGGTVDRTRPLCAHPAVIKYRGTGDPDAATSYTCAAPAAASGARR